jgi:transposase
MSYIAGTDRQQVLLFPETVDDYVGFDNPVRFLDAFVASLDLQALGFVHAAPAVTGRPPYHPGDLLKLYLYGYLHRIRSSRRLEAECHRNVELLWLLRKLAPDFKTIADFRKDNTQGLQAVCRQFTLLCRKLELFGGELFGIDGSKFKAVNSRENNFNEKKLQELLAHADARLAEYLRALDEADAAEPDHATAPRAELERKIAALREKKDWHEELLAELHSSSETQISLTDPQARRMHIREGSVVGYNAQLAVDAKHKLIAAADVTNEPTDLAQLSSMAKAGKEAVGVDQTEVVADTGYYNTAEVSHCVEHGITPYVPKADTSANTKLGLFGKNRFRYDRNKDVYVCPADKELTYRFSTFELGRALRYYRAVGCATCSLKAQCTRNKANRTITREQDEHLMEDMAQRLRAQPQKMRLRKQLCEHPFGTIKRWFGYDHFLLKGLAKVRTEWSLITLAYNWKRVLNLVSLSELMATLS